MKGDSLETPGDTCTFESNWAKTEVSAKADPASRGSGHASRRAFLWRAVPTIQAFLVGKDVFVEKPPSYSIGAGHGSSHSRQLACLTDGRYRLRLPGKRPRWPSTGKSAIRTRAQIRQLEVLPQIRAKTL